MALTSFRFGGAVPSLRKALVPSRWQGPLRTWKAQYKELFAALGRSGPGTAGTEAAEASGFSMDLRGPVLAGSALVVLGFGGFLSWAVLAPLHSAVVAPGVVAVETKRKVVQHLEGGIVAELAIREGQMVKAGDLLVRLDDTQSAARHSQLDAKRIAAAAEMARLEAELAGLPDMVIDPALAGRRHDPAVARAIAVQTDLLNSRRHDRTQRRMISDKQIEQVAQEVKGLQAQVTSREKRRALTDERLAGLRQLAGKGYASRVQVAALEGELAAVDGEIGDLTSRISAAEQKTEQLREQILSFEATVKSEIADRLQATRRDYAEAQEAILAAADVKQRTDIRSPITGTIVALKVHNTGAVVAPGEALMEVVPSEDTLVVEASVRVDDIDAVHPGLPVQVRLSAYSFRSTPPLDGTLVEISADRVVDPRTGTATYPARAVLSQKGRGAAPHVRLHPGMSAEVVIVKGRRTLLDYLLDPILRATDRAFIES